jgi:predicted dithiol-disulfide oxidoreductase (DUF899 family)
MAQSIAQRNEQAHKVVSHDEWTAARKELLVREKAFIREREALAAQRRALPWEKVDKEYVFEGAEGRRTLAELFDGRGQLVVYHFMFGPDWEAGCPHCSRWADSFDGAIVHLNHRDVTMVAVSRAPYKKLAAYRKRMGWRFAWLSSHGSDFNFDYGVSFTPQEMERRKASYNYKVQDPDASEREGISVFVKDGERGIFHTYSTFARGIDMMNVDYQYLDLVPKGRDEGGRGPWWVKRHDEYGK